MDSAVRVLTRVAGLVLSPPAVSGAPQPALYDAATERLGDLIDAATAVGDLDEANRLETWIWLDGPASPQGRVSGPPRHLPLATNPVVLRNPAPAGAAAGPAHAPTHLANV